MAEIADLSVRFLQRQLASDARAFTQEIGRALPRDPGRLRPSRRLSGL